MNPRTYNFVRSLGAGYFAIAVNIAYTIASVPLALHYLGKEQFGLWALAQQITGYLILLDLGVSSAVSRFIADRKDGGAGKEKASVPTAVHIVFEVGDEPTDSRRDAEVEQYEISRNLLG
jgi:hypothetical protein